MEGRYAHAQSDARPSVSPETRRIISGDQLRISVNEQPDLNRVYPVAGDGTIDFGYLGRIAVADRTVSEAAGQIERMLEATYFKDATVRVEMADFVEGEIMVMGAINRPTTIPFKSDGILTLMEAIMRCGGLAREADGTHVRILRWQPGAGMERQILTVDVLTMIENMDFSRDQYLRPRDIIMVPVLGQGENSNEFLALGEVGAPGFHPYSEGLDVIRAITRAGGVSREAKWDAARVLRPTSSGSYTVLPVNLARLFGSADMAMNIPLYAGDILFVPSERLASRGEIYLLGEVANPGVIPLASDRNMTLAKTILAAGGFKEFAAQDRVKILRNAPDGSKQTLIADVEDILKNGAFENDVPLENGDVVIVPENIWGF